METAPHLSHRPTSPRNPTRRRVATKLATIGTVLALVALTGCSSGAPPIVTKTVAPPAVTEDPGVGPAGPDPADPDPANPANPAGLALAVSQGAVSPGCTNSTCWYVHLQWEGLTPGWHEVQCVNDRSDIGAWSTVNTEFPTANGEKDLLCFIGYPGSHVWVIVDGKYASAPAAWE